MASGPSESRRYDLDNALGFWLHLCQNKIRNHADRMFSEHGINPEQWAVMVRLWEEDGRSQTELAQLTFRDKPSVTRMVDGLERRGYVVRGRNLEDGRSHRVVLTRAGRELEGVLVPRVRALVEQWTRGIPKADLAVTLRTLRALHDNVD